MPVASARADGTFPMDVEWTVLAVHLGGASVAGGQMKTTYGWYAGGNGTDLSGFFRFAGRLSRNCWIWHGSWKVWIVVELLAHERQRMVSLPQLER